MDRKTPPPQQEASMSSPQRKTVMFNIEKGSRPSSPPPPHDAAAAFSSALRDRQERGGGGGGSSRNARGAAAPNGDRHQFVSIATGGGAENYNNGGGVPAPNLLSSSSNGGGFMSPQSSSSATSGRKRNSSRAHSSNKDSADQTIRRVIVWENGDGEVSGLGGAAAAGLFGASMSANSPLSAQQQQMMMMMAASVNSNTNIPNLLYSTGHGGGSLGSGAGIVPAIATVPQGASVALLQRSRFMGTVIRGNMLGRSLSLPPSSPLVQNLSREVALSGVPFQVAVVTPFGTAVDDSNAMQQSPNAFGASMVSMGSPTGGGGGGGGGMTSLESTMTTGAGGKGGNSAAPPPTAVLTLDSMAPAERLSAPSALLDLRVPMNLPFHIPFCSRAARAAYRDCIVYTEGEVSNHMPDGLGNCGYFGLGGIDLEGLRSLILSNNGMRSEEAKEMRVKVIACATRQLVRRRHSAYVKAKEERQERRRERKKAERIAKRLAAEEAAVEAEVQLEKERSAQLDDDGNPIHPPSSPAHMAKRAKARVQIDTRHDDSDDGPSSEDEEELDAAEDYAEPLSEEEIIGEVVRLILLQSLVAFHPEQVHKVGRQVAKLLLKRAVDARTDAAAVKRDTMSSYKFPVGDSSGSTGGASSGAHGTAGGDMSPLLNETSSGVGAMLGGTRPASNASGGVSMSFFGTLPFSVPDAETLASSRLATVIDTALQDVYNVYQRLPRLYEAELVLKKDLRTRLLVYAAMKPALTNTYTPARIDQLLAKYQGLEERLEADIYAKYGPPMHTIDLYADWMGLINADYINGGRAARRRQSQRQGSGVLPSGVFASANSFAPSFATLGHSRSGVSKVFASVTDALSKQRSDAAAVQPPHAMAGGRRAAKLNDPNALRALESGVIDDSDDGGDDNDDGDGNSDLDILDKKHSVSDRGSIGSGGEGRNSRGGMGRALTSAQRIARRVTPQQLRMHAIASSAIDTYASLLHREAEEKAEAERRERERQQANLKTLFDDFEAQYAHEEYAKVLGCLGLDMANLHPSERNSAAAEHAARRSGGAKDANTNAIQHSYHQDPRVSGPPAATPAHHRKTVIDADDLLLL